MNRWGYCKVAGNLLEGSHYAAFQGDTALEKTRSRKKKKYDPEKDSVP